jgi:Flp pilus assembly protein TadG
MRWMTAYRDALAQFRAQPERGVTAVLTGVLMVGLVGFTGLAVDGGATFAKHQELQNGADAAALAAAQECGARAAAEAPPCSGANLQPGAGPYGEANVRNEKATVSTSFEVDLPEQAVTATVTGTKTHWFLPVVGVSDSELSPDATATWGSPYSGPSMIPLAVSQCNFEESLSAGEGIIEVYLPKNRGNDDDRNCPYGEDYPPGSFGWLDNADGCEVDITVDDWVETDTGVNDKPDCNWEDFIDEVVLIPIFDEDVGTGSNGEVHVSGFAALRVLGIFIHTGNEQYGAECVSPRDNQYEHQTCLRGEFIEYVTTADGYEVGGPDTEVTVIRLID